VKEEKKYKRDGLAGTIVVHVLILLFFIFTGLTHMVPKPEQGILINFGNSSVGSGNLEPIESGNPNATTNTDEPVETASEPTPSTPSTTEQVVTQDNVETVEVPEENEEKQKTQETEKKPKEEPEEEKPEISDPLKNALNKLKNSGQQGGSQGDDQNADGNKGQENGDKNGGAYTGDLGGGGNGNYNLGNRKALTKPRPAYNCQEEGTVVIEVRVDRNGKTVDAKVARGTTNYADCLTRQAKKAAMETKWQAKPDAPFTQIGTITYRFILN
jgi:TonB family protein